MTERTYHLPAADRTGWMLGLGGAQILPLAVGIAAAVVVVVQTGSAVAGGIPFVAGVAVAFTRIGGIPLLEAGGVALRYLARGQIRRFEAPFPFPGPELVLPACFGRVEFVEADSGAGSVLVGLDRRAGLAAATLRVAAPAPFLLCDEAEQIRFLDTFGEALAPLCREGGPVTSLRWLSMAAPAGRPTRPGSAGGPARGAYREVLDLLAGEAHHDVLVTLTVAGRTRGDAGGVIDTLLGEIGLLTDRLAGAGLSAAALDGGGFAVALRRRLDPAGRGSPGQLAALPGGGGPLAAAGPLCVEERWGRFRVDGTLHRAYHLVEWPRSEVPPGWTADLLLALPLTRALCVVFEPVGWRASRRAVERLAAKLDSDEEQRRRVGFRVGAQHEATRSELTAREHELVAGHPEFDYSGFVVLSAADVDELDELEAQARSVAAAAGVELAACAGRHAEGFTATLPLPLRPSRRRR
ncbi:MAG TPA: SCO6880 family protein [Acidimicrobiia bacterium]|nr:SCO6880 family protein [Acidimicrobiia bacterium]